MPVGRIENKDQVWLNGHVFAIRGQVQRQIANQFAPKTVIGDFTEQSDPVLSNITWRDLKDGMGRYAIHPDEQSDPHFHSFWYGNVRNTLPGHILPSSRIANSAIFARDSVGIRNGGTKLFKFAKGIDANSSGTKKDDVVWSIFSDSAAHTGGTPAWFLGRTGTFMKNLLSQPKDFEIGRVNGTTVFTIAESSVTEWGYGTDDLSDTAQWHSDTATLVHRLAFWRDALWGVSKTGSLYFSTETSNTATLNWVALGQTADVTDTQTILRLITGEIAIPGREDQSHLFLVRNDGFDIYDRLNETFEPALRLPPLYRQHWGGHVWNGSFYYPQGMSLYQWTPTGNGNVVTDVGFTTVDGVPDTYSGFIYDVASTPRELYVTVKAKNYRYTELDSLHDGLYSRTVNTGWTQVKTLTVANAGTATELGRVEAPMLIAGDKNTTNVNDTAGRMEIYAGWRQSAIAGIDRVYEDAGATTIGNDSHNNQMIFSSAATLVMPWVVSDPNQSWVAHKISTELEYLQGDGGAAATFSLDYATDFKSNDSDWVSVISVTTDSAQAVINEGLREVRLPNEANPIGVPFSALRLRARWSGGEVNDDGDHSYDMHRVSLTFQKKPKLRYAFQFEIDLRKEFQPQGRTIRETRNLLDAFYEQATLGEFAYGDDAPGGGRTYYVTPISPETNEESGHDPAGAVRMTVLEVV